MFLSREIDIELCQKSIYIKFCIEIVELNTQIRNQSENDDIPEMPK